MKNYFEEPVAEPKPFDYAEFVSRAKDLIVRATEWKEGQRQPGSPSFRIWRLELQDLVDRVRGLKYSVNCSAELREFGLQSDEQTEFDRDVFDTIIELDLIIRNYEKYGDPRPAVSSNGLRNMVAQAAKEAKQSATPAVLPKPEKVTIHWLLQNVEVSWFWSFGVGLVLTLIATFGLGMAAAGTKAGQAILEWVTPAK